MTDTNAATPRPWAVGGDDDSLWVTGPDTNANVVCDIVPRTHTDGPTEEDEANAALIVRAVNAHDPLVQAAQAALRELRRYERNDRGEIISAVKDAADDLEVALTLATQEQP